MTTLAHRIDLGGPAEGGVPARRALVRWAWRMFRREWRQQILVVTLLSVAVAAAIASITIVDHADPADDPQFGSANWMLRFDGSDPQKLQAGLAVARESFGTVDIIGHRSISVPGSVEKVDYRAQDPNGAYGSVLLALQEGSYPTQSREVAVTDGVAELLGLEIGDTLALDGRRRTVVGIVENPRKLSDEFALVAPSSAFTPDLATVLVDASDEEVETFFGPEDEPRAPALAGAGNLGNDHPEAKPLAMISVTTVFLLLASLIAAAGFAVVAQRRLRQLGMLAAVGATQKHVRLVLLANGAIVGVIAAAVGTIAGLAAWLLVAPSFESALGHRVDRLSLPWWLIATTVLLAVLGAAAAAWWPGRTVARLPVVLALSGRPPRPRPARHSAIAAAALIAVGIGCLAAANRERTLLIVAGIVATILGALLLGPLAIRLFSRVAGRVSIAPRLALRDLVRYQARSGAALAAVTLALGIAATVVVVVSAEEAEAANQPPNLSDRQIRVYLGPENARDLTPVDARARLGTLTASVERIAAQLDGATVIPLDKATQPGVSPLVFEDTRVVPAFDLTRRSEDSAGRKRWLGESELYVAAPAVLRYLGIDSATIDPSTDFLVDRRVRAGQLVLLSMTSRKEFAITNVQRIDVGERLFGSTSARKPPTFITIGGLLRRGWVQLPAGWLVESTGPLTSEQIADARDVAADAGFTTEVRHEKNSPTAAMSIATAAGAILALAILAMTVGLIRSEGAGDLRTLTATGASSRIRRTLTATTAGALALLGALLGVAGAYVMLAAMYYDDLGYLSDVPFLYLALAVAGVPLVAFAAGWLLAGREPHAIARTAIE
jgi:putative ABC transport system permease protein